MTMTQTAPLTTANDAPPLYTVADVASRLHISESGMRRAAVDGVLPRPIFMSGTRRFWRPVDIENYATAREAAR